MSKIDLQSATKEALVEEAAKKNNDLTVKDAKAIAPDVAYKVQKVANEELIAFKTNLANEEPWYKSRVIIGLAVSLTMKLAIAAGVLTETLNEEEVTTLILAAVSALGDLYALYGRTVTNKPIGE